MDLHFRAFSFVDRITSVQDGKQIRGFFSVPTTPGDFPSALVGEAVGQLAAWASMAAVNFEYRPVAGLAGTIEMLRAPRAGELLELSAELIEVNNESVQYNGMANRNGEVVVRLQDCIGPMLPLEDFDDPQALRERFAVLRQKGAEPRSFPPLPPLVLERTGGEPGRRVSAKFEVPSTAPLFADHFPRRPVFPGSLLMDVQLQLAGILVQEIFRQAGQRVLASEIRDMKLRSFVAPGSTLQLEAVSKESSPGSLILSLETRTEKELIATAGLVLRLGAGE